MQDHPILSGPQFPTDPRGHGLDLPALTDISAPRSRPHSRFAAPFPPSNSIIQFLSSELRGSTSRCCVLGSGPEVLLSWKVLQPWLPSQHATSSGHCTPLPALAAGLTTRNSASQPHQPSGALQSSDTSKEGQLGVAGPSGDRRAHPQLGRSAPPHPSPRPSRMPSCPPPPLLATVPTSLHWDGLTRWALPKSRDLGTLIFRVMAWRPLVGTQ